MMLKLMLTRPVVRHSLRRTRGTASLMASPEWAAAAIDRLVGAWQLGPSDRVIAHMSFMFDPMPGPLLERGVSSFLDAYSLLPLTDRFSLAWRDTLPQHFPTLDGLYRADGPVPQSKSIDQGKLVLSPNNSRCTASRGSTIPLFNNKVFPILSAKTSAFNLSVPVLQGWRAASSRFQQHSAEHPFSTKLADSSGRSSPDCTHYCLPGALFAHLSMALVRHILSDHRPMAEPHVKRDPQCS